MNTQKLASEFRTKLQLEVLTTLLEILRDAETPARDRLKAAEMLTQHGAEMLKDVEPPRTGAKA